MRRLIIVLIALMFSMLACNFPAPDVRIDSGLVPGEMTEQAKLFELIDTATALALTVNAPSATPVLATSTPVPTLTPEPLNALDNTFIPATGGLGFPVAAITTTAYCRTGPSDLYPIVTTLSAGQQLRVIARSTPYNYYVVENPNSPGFCWLSSTAATVSGDLTLVPEADPSGVQAGDPYILANAPVSCLSGPGNQNPSLAVIYTGEVAEIIGKDPSSTWWFVVYGDPILCWVPGSSVSVIGDVSGIPVITDPGGTGGIPPGGQCQLVAQNPGDGASFVPGANFQTTWTVRNTGASTWTANDYDFRFIGGNNFAAGSNILDLPVDVPPGETVDLSLNMFAPQSLGSYYSTWAVSVATQNVCVVNLSINVVQGN
jgi:uncharacterized protein YraI